MLQSASCLEPKLNRWCLTELKTTKLTLMIPPYFLCLPIFSDFHNILEFSRLFLKVFLRGEHAIARVSIVEYVLTFRHKFVSFVLPQNSSTIVSSACKKCANAVPSDTINWLLVVAEFCQFFDVLHFWFLEQTLHQFDVWRELLAFFCFWCLYAIKFTN